jgi:hypothetical protein
MLLSAVKFFAICFCISLCSNIYANEINIISSSIEYIELGYDPEYTGSEKIDINGTTFIQPVFADCDYIESNSNKPMLFVKSVLITVPSPSDFEIEKIRAENVLFENGLMSPTPTIVYNGEISKKYEYIPSIYNDVENVNWINVEYLGISGYRHIARVDFIASKYNQNSYAIERATKLYIKIRFNKINKPVEHLANDLENTINHNETKSWLITKKYNKNVNVFQTGMQNLNDISDGKWLKLGINKEGIYRITASDLQSRGINITPDQVNTIKIFGQSGKPISEKLSDDLSLNEQEIIVDKNQDGSLESIVFYASGASGFEMTTFSIGGPPINLQQHYLNFMDTKNYYLLTFGKTGGKRAIPIPEVNESTTSKPTTYKASIFHEEDRYMPSQFGTGVLWLGESISNNVPQIDNLYNFNKNGNVEYIFSVAHTSPQSNNISVYQGNYKLVEGTMQAITNVYEYAKIYTYYVSSPSSQIASDNRSVLKFNYSGMSLYPFYNFYEIHYPSDMLSINNEITLYSNIATYTNSTTPEIVEYSVNGFSGNIYGFDVSDMSHPKLLKNIANTGGMYIFKQKEIESNIRKYFISSNLQTPNIEEIILLNLRNINDENYTNVDVIVISPDEFLESAKNYADYRSKKSGFKISVVPINKIYAEFSYGRLDLTAVRNYIQYAVENWEKRPSYVVLWGTGTYDFRGIEGVPNYIPAHQRADDGHTKVKFSNYFSNYTTIDCDVYSYCTDDFYVCVVGNDTNGNPDIYPDVAIGRVPISSNAQGNVYIAKLEQYENRSNKGNWRRNVMIHADDGPTSSSGAGDRTNHTNQCEVIDNNVPPQFIVNKVYLPEFPVEYQAAGARRLPKATEEIFNQLNLKGNLIYLYSGHGNTNTLTHERTFTRDMLPQFTNEDKLFMFEAGSCEVGRFDHNAGTLSADIVLLPKTGAIASFAASRVSFAGDNTTMIAGIMKNALTKNQYNTYNTIGEASRIIKTSGKISNIAHIPMYILMGDPCLKLAAAELNIKIDEINGTEIVNNMETISAQGMSYLNIKGKIVSDNAITTTDFNGTINVILNEPKIDFSVTDEYGTKFQYKKNGATLNSGTFPVNNGEFNINLIIPADISFSKDKSLLYFYAVSDDDRYAMGMNNDIIIDGLKDSIINDGNGPEITIHLDSKLFKSGDTVARNPLLMLYLWDETSINTTGLGIGHKIEARIDNNPTPIDLTSSFSSSLTDSRAGDIQKYLGEISAGTHTLSVRAWDVFGNYTDESVEFVVPTIKDEGILKASFSPNPASCSDNIGIVIHYNVKPPIDATIIVFNETGKEVSNFDTQITNNGYNVVNFNTKDGYQLSNGTYYYHIKFKYDQTRTSYRWCEKFGCLGVIGK